MILADTPVWIDHLRKADATMNSVLARQQILIHPYVIGELAMGSLKDRDEMLRGFHELPRIKLALDSEVLTFVTQNKLFSLGIGFIDAHLLLSVRLTPGTLLWTRDRRLREAAEDLDLSFVN